MKRVPLGEICEFKYGKGLPERERVEGQIPVFGSNGAVGVHNNSITDGETIIIGRKGSIGELNFSPVSCWPIDTTYYIDRSATSEHLRWLYYALGGLGLTELNKATGIPGLNRNDAYEKRILVPSPDEQRRIAAILDQADALRRARRRAIERLNDLGQAIFYEMFGDPTTNPKDFPTRTLSEFYINEKNGTKCGPFGSALKRDEIVDSGIPVWNMDNIDPSGRMIMPFRMWITEDKYRELESYSVINGDVIISRAGTVGKMCVADAGIPASIISTNLIRVRFGPDLLPIYFVSLMTYCKGRVGRLKTGPDGAFTHMNTGVLDNLKFPYPPISLQRHFASIVENMEQQKALLHAHLGHQDTLFATLQHRAFRGEL